MLSAEQDAILQPARTLARNSREVVVGVPGIGATTIAYEERWVTLPFVYYLPPGEQSSVPSTHRPLHRAHKSTARISTGGKPPRVTPSKLCWLSLSPTPSTSSVEGYVMSTDRTPLQALPPVPCPFVASSMASVASTSSTPSSAGSHTGGPDCASTSLAASHTGIQTADGPNGPYVRAFKDAGNEHCGIMDWEKNCLFEKCDKPQPPPFHVPQLIVCNYLTTSKYLSGDTLFSISSSDTTPSSNSISDSSSSSNSISASAFGNDSASGRTSTSSVRFASSTPISDFHSWNSVRNQATRVIGGIKGQSRVREVRRMQG
ncbi:hypothetical protein JB92DRAFT_3124996 [Gautieria morchelliformis]|nr:hypothetical protein JB92DRAFT_3124996 [Gautieria morchelliformis]